MLEDYKFWVASIAVAMTFYAYIPYLIGIFKGKTKPHAFSWLLWGAVTGVGTLAQFDLNAGPSAWALAFVSVTCLMIAGLSFFIGERDYTKSDWFAFSEEFKSKKKVNYDGQHAKYFHVAVPNHTQIAIQECEVADFCWTSDADVLKRITVSKHREIFNFIADEFKLISVGYA